jgi:hypothetical protein
LPAGFAEENRIKIGIGEVVEVVRDGVMRIFDESPGGVMFGEASTIPDPRPPKSFGG